MKTDFTCQNRKKIAIKEKSKTQYVEISDIYYLKCVGYITTLYISNDTLKVSKLLKHFEEELIEYGFVRINRCTIVNLSHVKQYKGGSKRLIELSDGAEFSVSRRKVFLFRN